MRSRRRVSATAARTLLRAGLCILALLPGCSLALDGVTTRVQRPRDASATNGDARVEPGDAADALSEAEGPDALSGDEGPDATRDGETDVQLDVASDDASDTGTTLDAFDAFDALDALDALDVARADVPSEVSLDAGDASLSDVVIDDVRLGGAGCASDSDCGRLGRCVQFGCAPNAPTACVPNALCMAVEARVCACNGAANPGVCGNDTTLSATPARVRTGACGDDAGTTDVRTVEVNTVDVPPRPDVTGGCGDTMSSNENCGRCGARCTPFDNSIAQCSGGICRQSCTAGFDDCDRLEGNGCETNLTTDNANCGACGTSCDTRAGCVAGVCSIRCPLDLDPCDVSGRQMCVNLQANASNCGRCGAACAVGQLCVLGTCTCSMRYTCEGDIISLPRCGSPPGIQCPRLTDWYCTNLDNCAMPDRSTDCRRCMISAIGVDL